MLYLEADASPILRMTILSAKSNTTGLIILDAELLQLSISINIQHKEAAVKRIRYPHSY